MTSSTFNGSVYRRTNAQTAPAQGSGFYTGTLNNDAAFIDAAVASANSASASAGAMSNATSGLTFGGALSGVPSTISLTTAASITGLANSTYVMNLNDFILSGAAASLTLNGANTTNYIFNVSRFMTLSGGSKLLLANGLTEANVLFNVKSAAVQYDVTLSGGSEFHGIILAPTRNVKATGGSTVAGEVIARGVSLSGASKVINPFVSN